MRPILAALVVPATIAILGCSSPNTAPVGTPTGFPDVSFKAPKKEVMNQVLKMSLGKGYQIKSNTEFSLTVGKLDTSFAAALLGGSRYDSTPEVRIQFTFVENQETVRVTSTAALVTNPGSGFERPTQFLAESKIYGQIQSALLELKQKVESSPAQSSLPR